MYQEIICFFAIILIAAIVIGAIHSKNTGLQKRNAELEKMLNDYQLAKDRMYGAEAKLALAQKEIELLKYQMLNPPKYKIGDKVGACYIVTGREFISPVAQFIAESLIVMFRSIFGTVETAAAKEKRKASEKKIDCWRYEVVHLENGKKVTFLQYELCEMDDLYTTIKK